MTNRSDVRSEALCSECGHILAGHRGDGVCLHCGCESGSMWAEVERLRELALEAVRAARLFNRDGMTWMEYDRLLARIERESSDITAEEDR